jgi:uncharacterized protein
MTPQEQQLVADLFNRLASLEGQRRDPDAERLIREGLGVAPNSVYALVQTVLVQDEALKRASARIEELERAGAAPAESGGGFLDNVRGMFGGQPRSSVPPVKPSGQGSSGVWGSRPDAGPPPGQASGQQPSGQPWGNPQGYPQGYPQGGYPPPPPPGYPPAGYPQAAGGGHSFLGTAAATVAGVVGGAMLLNGIRGMMGGSEGFSPGHHDPSGGLPHGGSPSDSGAGHGSGDQGSGNLSQDAGLGDIGGGHRAAAWDRDDNQDNNNNDNDKGSFLGGNVGDLAGDQSDDGDFDTGGNDDGGDGGDFDTA